MKYCLNGNLAQIPRQIRKRPLSLSLRFPATIVSEEALPNVGRVKITPALGRAAFFLLFSFPHEIATEKEEEEAKDRTPKPPSEEYFESTKSSASVVSQ